MRAYQRQYLVEACIVDDDEERDIAFAQKAALAADPCDTDPMIGESLNQASLVLPLNDCDK
jgi:hypothetical protein